MRTAKILSIKHGGVHEVFDLEIEKNHNFVANQHVVHNCMDLAEHVGGFPKEQCDNVRRAIMKRDHSKGEQAKKDAAAMEEDFVKGALNRGVPEDVARKAYQNILYFSGYAFNRCFAEKTGVNTYHENGDRNRTCMIKDVSLGEYVMSRDECTKKNVLVKVKNVHFNGLKDLVRVTLKSGEAVECTMDHKFRTVETGEMLPLNQILDRQLSIVVEHE